MGSSPDKELAYSQQEMGVLGARPANPCDIQDFDFTSFFFQREHLDFEGILCVRDLELPKIG